MPHKAQKRAIRDSVVESYGTGDEDREGQAITAERPSISGFEEVAKTVGTGDLEEERTAAPSRPIGMTFSDLIDKWLTRTTEIRYVMLPLAIYGLAVFSGHCKSWAEFGFASLAGGALVVLLFLVEVLCRAGRRWKWW